MSSAILSREEVLTCIVATFRQHGYEGSSLALLSKATGLGRSSLYHYFPKGKVDMANAALEWVLDCFDEQVLSPLRQTSQPPLERLHNCAKGLAEFYADGARSCLIDIFSIGSAATLFQTQLGECTKALIRIFSEIARESGVSEEEAMRRGEDVIVGIQGVLVVSRTIGSNAPFLRFLKEFPQQLLRAE